MPNWKGLERNGKRGITDITCRRFQEFFNKGEQRNRLIVGRRCRIMRVLFLREITPCLFSDRSHARKTEFFR